MTDRTTLNIDSTEHKAAREVKDEYDESWTDVLQFYRRHRHELSLENDGESNSVEVDYERLGGEVAERVDTPESATDISDELDKLKELIENVPEESAEIFGRRYQ